mmetsp:Transcript_2283/g.3471  ORF Transcript_2283/g.3471 Transcript_2283/m.3471 type:complete len:840 (-) Transcript_2283:714-3233(-)
MKIPSASKGCAGAKIALLLGAFCFFGVAVINGPDYIARADSHTSNRDETVRLEENAISVASSTRRPDIQEGLKGRRMLKHAKNQPKSSHRSTSRDLNIKSQKTSKVLGRGKSGKKISFDANNDRMEDSEDISFVARAIADPLGEITPGDLAADVNKDGVVDLDDLRTIIDYFFSILPPEDLRPIDSSAFIDDILNADIGLPNESPFPEDDPSRSLQLSGPIITQACGVNSFGRYAKGVGSDPAISWNPQYSYDPNIKPNLSDYSNYATYTVLLQGAWKVYKEGADGYNHFRHGLGKDLPVNYEIAIQQDESIKAAVDAEIKGVLEAAQALHDGCETSFRFHSVKHRGVKVSTNNWKLALGYHAIWSDGTVQYDKNSCTLNLDIGIWMEDLYDFAQASFLDPVNYPNGRFVQLGWAQNFYSKGGITRRETVQLQNCENNPCCPEPTAAPVTPRPTRSQETGGGGRTSGVFGDPHLSTFDRLRFDCQAAGEFTMVTSLQTPAFKIQERFIGIGSNVCSQASVSTGIAISEVDLSTIQLSIPRDGTTVSGTETVINSCPVNFFVDDNEIPNGLANVPNIEGIRVIVSERRVTFLYSFTGVQIRVTIRNSEAFGCFLTVQNFLPFDYRSNETIVGLLGTPNGNRLDDWVAPNGSSYSPPADISESIFSRSYQYCVENWCLVDESESIFTYREGETFDSISKCYETYDDDIEGAVEDAKTNRLDLVQICGSTDNIFCLVEGICGGPAEAATALLEEADIIASQENSNPVPSATPSISLYPSGNPTISLYPTSTPSLEPSQVPTSIPTVNPSLETSGTPSIVPSQSQRPSFSPSKRRSKSGKKRN